MGTKVTVSDITNIVNSSGTNAANTNFDTVADEFDKVLYRDGSLSVTGDVDFDSNRILNLPSPISNTEPIRLGDVSLFSQGSPGANVEAVGIFSQIATFTIPTGTDIIRTSGYSTAGVGDAVYVSDATATEALALNHPRFCKQTANGRYFRLYPIDNTILPEQGGAVGDPSELNAVNDQPIFQACLDYAYAVGVKAITLKLTQRAYSLWMPVRTSPPRSSAAHATDGHGLVILYDQQVRLVGDYGGNKVKCNWRAYLGGSFDGTTAGVNWHLVADPSYPPTQVWRGSGIFLSVSNSDPGAGKRSSVEFNKIIWNGGTLSTHDNVWPANTTTGAGWDTSHKGIYVEADRRYGGDISIVDSDLVGWRGELVYTTNNTGATASERSKFYARNAYFAESNGQGINPNGCNLDVECFIENCCIGIEGWTGDLGGYVKATIKNCYSAVGTGGACTLQGGIPGSPTWTPTRVTAGIPPIGKIDLTFIDCTAGYLGSWLTGKITCIDTPMFFGGSNFTGVCKETDLDCVFIADKRNDAYPRLGGNTAGSYSIQSVNLRIRHERTANAVTNGFQTAYAIDYYSSLGANVFVDMQGTRNCLRAWSNSQTLHDYAPTFSGDAFTSLSDVSAYNQNVETTPAIALRGPVIAMTLTNPGVYTATLPTTNIVKGQQLWLWNNYGNDTGIVRLNGLEASGSGVRGNGDIYIPGGRGLLLKFGGTYWEPVGRPIRSQRLYIPFIDQTGLLAVGTGKGFTRCPVAARVVGVGAWVNTAQAAGSLLTFDIMEGGTTIMATTKLTLDNAEKTSTTAATAAVVTDFVIAADAELRADITQVGTPAAIGGGVWLDIIPT